MLELTSKELIQFIKDNNEQLENIQADITIGDITGHGEEWEARLTIESHEHNDDNEYYDAIFSVIDVDGKLESDFQIGVYTSEGKVEKFEIDFTKFTSKEELLDSEQLANCYKILDLSETSIETLTTFIDQCYPVMEKFTQS